MSQDIFPAAPQPIVDLERGELRCDGSPPIPLDTPIWIAWLARAHSFKVIGGDVLFLVVRETRSRGSAYWVARGYVAGKRSSSYLGKQITAETLRSAAATLAEKLANQEPPAPAAEQHRVVLSKQQLTALLGDCAPADVRRVLAAVRAGTNPEEDAALAVVAALVDAVWPEAINILSDGTV